MNIDVVLAVGGALAAIFKWVWEYTKKLQWEQNRFLLEELEKFHALETTIVMERLLDWNRSSVVIKGREIDYDDDLLSDAFTTHNIKHTFTRDQLALRDIFDDYFDSLTKLVVMCESGLIPKKNMILFLEYWLNILAGVRTSKSKALVQKIRTYLEFYGYFTLTRLLDEIIQKHKKPYYPGSIICL